MLVFWTNIASSFYKTPSFGEKHKDVTPCKPLRKKSQKQISQSFPKLLGNQVRGKNLLLRKTAKSCAW
jgi:hypothetical protein